MTNFFCVKAPVPLLDRMRASGGKRGRFDCIKLGAGALLGGFPHFAQQFLHSCGLTCHAIDERVISKRFVAVQIGLFEPQF